MSNEATVGVQADGSQTDIDPNTDPLANADPTSDQALGMEAIGDEQIGPDSIPPELEETRKQLLRAFHQKTQTLAEERGRLTAEMDSLRQKAEMMDKLMAKQWFQKAAQDEQSRLAGGGLTPNAIPDEQFEAARNGDKTAFMQIVSGLAQQMVNSQVAPAVQGTQEALADLQVNRELDNAITQYPDIQDLIDEEDPVFFNYLDQGYDYETAYQKYAFGNATRQAPAESGPSQEQIAQESRNGSVARVGLPQVRGNRILKARNFEDAFDQAFAALQRGERDFTFERS